MIKNTPAETRIIALDYGNRRIGTAVTDSLGITAQVLPTLKVKNKADAVAQVIALIARYNSVRVVLGLPRSLSGGMGKAAEEVRKFGAALEEQLHVAVEYVDERFTSRQAENVMRQLGEKPSRKKEKVDSLSAVFILQCYLEMQENVKGNERHA